MVRSDGVIQILHRNIAETCSGQWTSIKLPGMNAIRRRQFIKQLGISTASLPFLLGLPSLGLASPARPRQRLIIMFSPNGTIPPAFWPEETGTDFKLKEIMAPLEPFKDRMLVLHGLCNRVRGDGDNHMRGMSCLLTGIELFPGNIQGGSDTPAGWASGISIDQELKKFLPKPRGTPHAIRVTGVWCRRYGPGGPVDTNVVRRSKPADCADF